MAPHAIRSELEKFLLQNHFLHMCGLNLCFCSYESKQAERVNFIPTGRWQIILKNADAYKPIADLMESVN